METARTHRRSILLLCGDYMEDYEAMVAFQALQAFGLSVHAVCPGKTVGEFCRTAIHGLSGSHPINYYERIGHKFTLNAAFDEIEWSQYEGLVIPGGRAPEYLAVNASVVNLVRKFSTSGKPMAAICHGSLVLAAADAVRGRKCTAYPGVRHVLKDAGAIWVEPKSLADCVADGNVVTGVTYFGNPEFIRLFVAALGGTISGATNKRILLLCGDHMEDYEVTVPFHTLEALGCLVDAVCPYKKKGETCLTVVHDWEEGSQTYSEKIGQHFTLTADFNSISNSKYDALVIPGGRAPEVLALEGGVVAIVKEFMGANKPVGSIGHGAQILAAAGVLKGRKCTGHPAVKLDIGLAGASWLEPAHVDRSFTDGNLVTAASWSAHPHFLAELMGLLGIHVSFN